VVRVLNALSYKTDGRVRLQRLLITGASGFLGWNLCQYARGAWDVHGVAFRNNLDVQGVKTCRADLTRFDDTKRLLREVRPDVLIHAAASADLNYCQLNRSESYKINVRAAAEIASLCADCAVRFVFISTDIVFDGLKAPYKEEDPVSPINVYGEQKAEAERMVIERNPETIICRMPLMFGEAGPVAKSFLQPMILAMREGRDLMLFTDEYRTPISGRNAAKGIFLALLKTKGLLHLGGSERISRFDFGVLLRDVLGARGATLVPCSRLSIPMPAPRPGDVSFDSTKAGRLGFKTGGIRQELEELIGAGVD
jgi:dTDP-4-dehydrorhamnose reductase